MNDVICIGAALMDELFFAEHPFLPHTSNPASVERSVGGVVTNIARHLALTHLPIKLITYLGKDLEGEQLENTLRACGVQTEFIEKSSIPTGKFTAFINPDGNLYAAACADPTAQAITEQVIAKYQAALVNAHFVIADTNLHEHTLAWLISFCRAEMIRLIIEPVSVTKSKKINLEHLSGVHMVTPNEDELAAMTNLQGREAVQMLLQKGVQHVWVRMGKEGSKLYSQDDCIQLPAPFIEPLDTTGAGDATLAGWIFAQLHQQDLKTSMAYGHALAAAVMSQKGTVIESLNKQMIEQLKQQYYPHVS